MKHEFSKMLTPILLTLLTVAVTGLDDSLATESKAKAQKVAHTNRLANQLKTRDGPYHYRHHNQFRPLNVHYDKYNQPHSTYEAPKLQHGSSGSTKHYNQHHKYNSYVPVYPETPYSRPQTSNYESASYIYPLSHTESPIYAYPQPSYPSPHSPSYYSQPSYVPQAYTEASYSTSEPHYPPLYYKDLKKIHRPYNAITVSRPTEHEESNHNGYINNEDEEIPYEYANHPNEHVYNQNEYANIPNEYGNNHENVDSPTQSVKIPNKYANSHSEYATSNTYKRPTNNQSGYTINNANKYANIPNKYTNSHAEFENNASDFPKFEDFLKHSLTQFPKFRFN